MTKSPNQAAIRGGLPHMVVTVVVKPDGRLLRYYEWEDQRGGARIGRRSRRTHTPSDSAGP